MTAPRVDVVLARDMSASAAARAIATLADEAGLDLRIRQEGDASPPGDYLVALAAGVVPLPGAIARMLRAAAESSDAVLVLGVAVAIDADGEGAREPMRERAARHHARAARFADASFVTVYGPGEVAAVLCRRSGVADASWGAVATGGPAALLDAADPRACRVLADPVAVRLGGGPNLSIARRVGAALDRLRARRRTRTDGMRSTLTMSRAALEAAAGLEGGAERLRVARRRLWERIAWGALIPLRERLHDAVLSRFGDWPLAWRPRAARRAVGAPRVAYYLWRFPVVSETFIRRELGALAQAGVEVAVLADGAGGGASDDPELAPLVRRTSYVLPASTLDVLGDLLAALARRPLRTLNLLVYTVCRPYHVPKTPTQDVRVFLKAVRVAALLRRLGITHLHAPWGDTNAFVAMVAARLADADFSVQFRAQDLHRRTLAFEVREKVHHARFVVTNTRYNLEHLRALSDPEDHAKLRQIYNGLELARFAPARGAARPKEPVRILAVARLVEQKGLPYLFAACRILLDRGRDLRCTVIGGPELPLYVNDLIEIRRVRRRLGLDRIVELRGAQPFVHALEAYQSSDVFVLPCVVGADASIDIIPNSILEAMAMGVPVVTTRITAIAELIEDGANGLLVAPNDARAVADAIERLCDDPAFAARLAANARARVAERFDVAQNVRAYAALFGASR